MGWFLNQYLCADCGREWEDGWSCACDDDCPHCGARHMVPCDSIDLTEIIEESDGKFLVYRSPDSAGNSPDYELIAECSTRVAAAEIVNGGLGSKDRDGAIDFVD